MNASERLKADAYKAMSKAERTQYDTGFSQGQTIREIHAVAIKPAVRRDALFAIYKAGLADGMDTLTPDEKFYLSLYP